MTDEFEVSVGSDSIRLAARGENAGRFTDAVAGFVSPVTEGTAWIGDVVRMYRQRSAIRGLARARELAEELSVPVRPVAPKFLMNWLEGVSLEEEDSSLTELWAGLLVSGTRDLKPNHLRFQRMLREMTPRHHEFFQYLCDADAVFRCLNLRERLERVVSYNDKSRRMFQELPSIDEFMIMASGMQRPGLKAIHVERAVVGDLGVIKPLEYYQTGDTFVEFFNDGTYGALGDFGLVARDRIIFTENYGNTRRLYNNGIIVHYIYISNLGIEFIEACGGEESSSAPSVDEI